MACTEHRAHFIWAQKENEPVTIKKVTKEQRFSFPFIPSFGQSESLSISNNFILSFTSLMFLGFILFNYINTYNETSKSRKLYENDLTKLYIDNTSVEIESRYPDILNVAITFPDLNKQPNFYFLENEAFLRQIAPDSRGVILISDVFNEYSYNPQSDSLLIRVHIFSDLRDVIQDETQFIFLK